MGEAVMMSRGIECVPYTYEQTIDWTDINHTVTKTFNAIKNGNGLYSATVINTYHGERSAVKLYALQTDDSLIAYGIRTINGVETVCLDANDFYSAIGSVWNVKRFPIEQFGL